jgi:hypothetical protein
VKVLYSDRVRVRSLVVVVSAGLLLGGCGGAADPAPPDLSGGQSGGSGSGGSGGSTTTHSAPSGPAECKSATLKVSLGPSEGAAGTVHAPLRFTNSGDKPCFIQGFPGVSYVAGGQGTQVGPAAEREGAKGGPITLEPGKAASAQLGMVQVLNYDAAACKPTPVRGLRVYPPDETASVFVEAPSTGCAGTPPGPQLTVGTLTASPAGN